MIERAHELVRKAKENLKLGNIQEAANLYSDAAEIYQNMYKQTSNEEAKKTIQQLFIQADKEAKRIMRLIIEKQNKDNVTQQQNNSNAPIIPTSNISLVNGATSSPSISPFKNHPEDKYRINNITNTNNKYSSPLFQASNVINSPDITKNPQNINTSYPFPANPPNQQEYSFNKSYNNLKQKNNTGFPYNTNINNNNNNTNNIINNNQSVPINSKNQELNAVRQNVLYNRPKPALNTRNSTASRNYFIGQTITNSAILMPPQSNFQENNNRNKPNYNNHEPATIPVISLNSSTVDENTSSHFIDQSYFVLKETKKDEAEKAFIKFWDVIDNLVQNKVSMPVALFSVPLNKDDTTVNQVKKDNLSSTQAQISELTSKSTNKNKSIATDINSNLNTDSVKKSDQKLKNKNSKNDFEIIDQDYIEEVKDDINFTESDYLVIPQKELPKKTIEEYQLENEKLKETINQISNDYLLLPNTEEFKLALRKAKEYVKYNEYLQSTVVAGSENELSELKKRVAYLEENNLVKQIMTLEEVNKALRMENEKLKQENIKYKNQWDKFVAIAEAKKKKMTSSKLQDLSTNINLKTVQRDTVRDDDIESPHLFNKPTKNNIVNQKYSSNNTNLFMKQQSQQQQQQQPLQLFKNNDDNVNLSSIKNINNQYQIQAINHSQLNSESPNLKDVLNANDDDVNTSITNNNSNSISNNDDIINDNSDTNSDNNFAYNNKNQLYYSSPTPEFDILQHMKSHHEMQSQTQPLTTSMINNPNEYLYHSEDSFNYILNNNCDNDNIGNKNNYHQELKFNNNTDNDSNKKC